MLLLLLLLSQVTSVVSDSVRPHRQQPTRLPCPWDSPGNSLEWVAISFSNAMHESEKWKWSCSVVSDSSRPHGLQPTSLLHPWDFPGKSTGVRLTICSHILYNFVHNYISLQRMLSWNLSHVFSRKVSGSPFKSRIFYFLHSPKWRFQRYNSITSLLEKRGSRKKLLIDSVWHHWVTGFLST